MTIPDEAMRDFGETARDLFIRTEGEWNSGLTYEEAEQAYQLAWAAYDGRAPMSESLDSVPSAARALLAEWRESDEAAGDV